MQRKFSVLVIAAFIIISTFVDEGEASGDEADEDRKLLWKISQRKYVVAHARDKDKNIEDVREELNKEWRESGLSGSQFKNDWVQEFRAKLKTYSPERLKAIGAENLDDKKYDIWDANFKHETQSSAASVVKPEEPEATAVADAAVVEPVLSAEAPVAGTLPTKPRSLGEVVKRLFTRRHEPQATESESVPQLQATAGEALQPEASTDKPQPTKRTGGKGFLRFLRTKS